MVFLQVLGAIIVWSVVNLLLMMFFVKHLGKSTVKVLVEPLIVQLDRFDTAIGNISNIYNLIRGNR